MLDYSKAVHTVITNGQKYYPPADGWVILNAGGSPAYRVNQWYINGYVAYQVVNPQLVSDALLVAATDESYTTIALPISKKDYVTHFGSAPGTVTFVPFKK